MTCPMTYKHIGFPGGPGSDISSNDNNFFYNAANLNATIIDESAAMARSQQARGLVDHATGTAADLDTERME